MTSRCALHRFAAATARLRVVHRTEASNTEATSQIRRCGRELGGPQLVIAHALRRAADVTFVGDCQLRRRFASTYPLEPSSLFGGELPILLASDHRPRAIARLVTTRHTVSTLVR